LEIAKGRVVQCTKTKKEQEEAKGGKAGHPGCFHGDMLKFLQSHVEAYQNLPIKSQPGHAAALSKFWENVIIKGFWAEFKVDKAQQTILHGKDLHDSNVMSLINEVSSITIDVQSNAADCYYRQ
jgi:hypothetical protein